MPILRGLVAPAGTSRLQCVPAGASRAEQQCTAAPRDSVRSALTFASHTCATPTLYDVVPEIGFATLSRRYGAMDAAHAKSSDPTDCLGTRSHLGLGFPFSRDTCHESNIRLPHRHHVCCIDQALQRHTEAAGFAFLSSRPGSYLATPKQQVMILNAHTKPSSHLNTVIALPTYHCSMCMKTSGVACASHIHVLTQRAPGVRRRLWPGRRGC